MRRRILIPYLNLKHRSKSYPLKGTYVKRAVFIKKLFVFNFGELFVDILSTIAKMMKNKSQPFNVHFLPLLGYLVTRPFMVYAIWQGICFNFNQKFKINCCKLHDIVVNYMILYQIYTLTSKTIVSSSCDCAPGYSGDRLVSYYWLIQIWTHFLNSLNFNYLKSFHIWVDI